MPSKIESINDESEQIRIFESNLGEYCNQRDHCRQSSSSLMSFERLDNSLMRYTIPEVAPKTEVVTWSLPEHLLHNDRSDSLFTGKEDTLINSCNPVEDSSLDGWDSMSESLMTESLPVEMRTLCLHQNPKSSDNFKNISGFRIRSIVCKFREKFRSNIERVSKPLSFNREEFARIFLRTHDARVSDIDESQISAQRADVADENAGRNLHGLNGNKKVIMTAIANVCLPGNINKFLKAELLKKLDSCSHVSVTLNLSLIILEFTICNSTYTPTVHASAV